MLPVAANLMSRSTYMAQGIASHADDDELADHLGAEGAEPGPGGESAWPCPPRALRVPTGRRHRLRRRTRAPPAAAGVPATGRPGRVRRVSAADWGLRA